MRLALLAALLATPALAQPVPADVLARAAPAVLRIDATCGGETRSGTGFAWQQPGRVVTAFHVVAGCGSISVYYQGLASAAARVEHVLPAADLALLAVDNPPTVTPLAAGPVPHAGETVNVYGFPLGLPTRSDAPLYVTAANAEAPLLRDSVPDGEREQLRAAGIPSLDTEILRVDGNLLPGNSGAPLLNHDGRVVAIGSGGLQRGTVGVGWAVRAHYLTDLAVAPAAPPAGAVPRILATSFATVSPSAGAGRSVHCAGLTLVWTRTLSLQELIASSDDPGGLFQIAASTQQPIQAFAADRFDVWTEPNSGGGVAVPSGAALRSGATQCLAQWSGGAVTMAISGTLLTAPPLSPAWQGQVQFASVAFEQQWAAEFFPYLVSDPRFSYVTAQERRGGMIVNRKFFMGQKPGNAPPYGILETLMAKGKAFIGIAVVNRRYLASPLLPPDLFHAWVSAGFAAHLSTFPP